MTDLLESADTSEASTVPSAATTTSTPLPPPPPLSLDDGTDTKRQRMLAVVATIALVAAVVMGFLWLSALSSRDDAESERDAAQAAATVEADRSAEALDALAATEVDLDAERTENEQLAAELAAAQADADTGAAATARADEAEAALVIVNMQNDELAAEVAALTSSLADAEATAPVPAFDINTSPDFARYIGEQLSSTSGPTVLGEGQTTCLGTAVVIDIGLDALGAGLNAGASSSETTVVFDSIGRAAITCGIDPSAIF